MNLWFDIDAVPSFKQNDKYEVIGTYGSPQATAESIFSQNFTRLDKFYKDKIIYFPWHLFNCLSADVYFIL